MLQSENRLTKVRDFNLLMNSGRWIRGGFLDIRFSLLEKIPQKELPKKIITTEFYKQLKIAFTVGVKVDKRAVVRNRLRRQLREVVRLLIQQKKIRAGYYILFVVHKQMCGKSHEEIENEVKKTLSLAKILI